MAKGEKIIGIEPLLKGDPGKALIRLAKQGDHAETWTLIRSWWKDGELPGKLFEALCQAQGVEPEPNPFLSAPEPQDEQDDSVAREEHGDDEARSRAASLKQAGGEAETEGG